MNGIYVKLLILTYTWPSYIDEDYEDEDILMENRELSLPLP